MPSRRRFFTMAVRAGLPLVLAASAQTALAAEPDSCRSVRFSDVGWTDITATTATVSVVLEALGYQPETKLLSIPITFAGLKEKDIDVYLGDWQPAMLVDRQPYLDDGSIEVIGPNLTGAKYTLAVPKYVAEAGVKDFADLAANAEKFGRNIYGLEPGNSGNVIIEDMIKSGDFNLTDWKLVESSEQGMLSQVERAIGNGDWIVFQGWAPHPMNSKFPLEYLSGGDAYFGPDFGGAEVYTNVRAGLAAECPNVGKLLSQITFTIEMENEIMAAILDEGQAADDAALAWLKSNPGVLDAWLVGATTFDGNGPALDAVKSKLGL